MSISAEEHSKYPGALVGPDGEIYFRRNADEASRPATQTDQPENRKD